MMRDLGVCIFGHAAQDAELKTSDFCQSAQSSYGRIARIGLFLQIIQHLVTMVGSDRNMASLEFHGKDEFSNDGIHVHVSFEVVVFKKIPFCIPSGAAQVDEVDSFRKLAYHGRQIIFRNHPKRARTKAHSIARRGHSLGQFFHIRCGTHHAGVTRK